MKRAIGVAVLSIAAALAGSACGKKSDGAPGTGAASTGGSGGAAATVSATGIKECDDYVAKIDACFAKDAKLKEEMEPQFRAQIDAWKQAAASNKDGTRALCKTALDTLGIAYPTCK